MTPRELLGHLADVGTPPEDGVAISRLSVGLEASLERFAQETLPFIAGGGGDLQFIRGAYGRGKTHYLKALSHYATERHFVTSYVDCQEYRTPFRSMVETYRAIAAGMTPPGDGPFFGTTGITKVIEAQFVEKEPMEQRTLIERVKADRALVADFRNLVRAYVAAVMDENGEDRAELLENFLAATPSFRMPFRELYRRYQDLPRPLGKLVNRNATIWLRALLSLPQVLGYRGLLVCFDETETALQRGRRSQRLTHLAHIRTFVDHLAAGAFRGCAVYYAVAEDFVDEVTELGALAQRIDRVHVPDILQGATAGHVNPRAVSVDLDELTMPDTKAPRFFIEVAQRIVDIGGEAGLSPQNRDQLMDKFREKARKYATEIINEGGVREFVKKLAGSVIQYL